MTDFRNHPGRKSEFAREIVKAVCELRGITSAELIAEPVTISGDELVNARQLIAAKGLQF